MWLEAEVGDAVTGLELREKPGTVVRNSEAVAVSSCSGQHTQMCTHTHIGLGKSIITNLKKNDCNITLTTNINQIGRSHIKILVCIILPLILISNKISVSTLDMQVKFAGHRHICAVIDLQANCL